MTLYREMGTLSVTAPFDFSKSLQFVGDFSPTDGEQSITADTLTKALMIEGHTVAFRLKQQDNQLAYELFSDRPLPDAVRQAVLERLSFFLSLQDDLTPFYEIGQADPCFAPIVQQYYGMHPVKFPTLVEIAVWSILTQHTPIPVARKIKRAMIQAYGSSITVEGQTYWAFPDLDRLLAVNVDDLTALIGNSRKAGYIVGLVHALSQIDEMWLRTAPYTEAEAKLRRIKGIGAWSTAFILLRGLGRMEYIPHDMKAFLKILPQVYGPEATMAQIGQRYGKWFGYWGLYMRAAN